MKRSVLILCLSLYSIISFSQTVPFPSPDPPRDGNFWPYGYSNVGTPASFNTSPFLPFWFNGLRMRIMPPTGITYNSTTRTWNIPNNGQKYPVILFFHGNGESGFDNNNQLKHGGQTHMQAVQSGAFPGFLVYPQDVTYDQGKQILEEMISTLPVDINRIYVHGLSGGGGKAWQFAINYPTLTAAAFPMSATDAASMNQGLLYQPFRESQGALDTNPSPTQSQGPVDYFNNNGGHLEYFVLQGVGHGTWNTMYARADFFPWFLAQKKNKIFVRFDRNLICPEAPISVDMGFTPGFQGYEWRKDGVLISGATGAKYIATSYGSYTGRILNRGVWSDWSDPITVGPKPTTNTPPITTNGLKSTVLPSLDGATTTELALPEGYASYSWKNASNQTVSTARVFTNVGVGNYTASANEVNGCATIASPVFKVISADGVNKPDAVTSLLGYAPTQSSIALSWTDNPSPAFNETGFEVYRSKTAESGYALVGITGADVISFTDNNLTSNTTYFYKVRPINATSAGPVTGPISAITLVDAIAPTAPSNLTVTATAPTTINLSWGLSTDNVGVYRYDVFKDGAKVLSLPNTATTATIYNLVPNTSYDIYVKARDLAGNYSTESNLVTANSVLGGFSYQYYELTSTPSALPNFSTLTPVEVGTSGSLDITVRNRTTNYAIQWTGTITIPTTGSYTFVLNAARGARLYINNLITVDHDGNHSASDKEGTRTFNAGTYPVTVQVYANGSAGSIAALAWKNTASGVGNTKTTIPLSYFTPTLATGATPTPPDNLVATAVAFNKINLTWSDVSNNETGFRIYRATTATGPYLPVASVGANTTSYQDTNLTGNTTYYYRITSFGEFGESGLSLQVPRGFTCTYYEAPSLTSISQFANLVPKKVVSGINFFDATLGVIRERSENFGIKFVGKINITTAATYTFYTSTDDGSTLLIDGTQVVSNDTDGNQHEKSGTKALTVGWHDIVVNWRKRTSSNTRITVSYQRTGVSKTAFSASNGPTWFVGTEVNAKTLVTPPAPAVATGLNITNIQPFSLKLNWLDNATNETGYQVLRSFKTNTSYVVYRTLAAGTTSFIDEGLFANASYFYKVVAVGDGGQTTSAEVTATTANEVPDLTAINDVVVKYGKTLDVNIYSVDADNDPITLTVNNLPSFATFANHGDGSGVIHITPAQAHVGNYTISVTAADNHSGSETDAFVLTVTDKDVPVILPITNATVSEGQTAGMTIGATSDFGAENLTWSFNGLPEFATYQVGNGTCSITLAPGYIHSGPYTVQVTVTDQLQATATKTFTINVNDVDPNQKWSVNISGGSTQAAPWNNVTGLNTASLRNQLNAVTGVGMAFQTTAWNTFNQGQVTGNNSGVFPDNVLREYYYFGIFGNPETVDVKMTGLSVNQKYTFNFVGSSQWTGVPDNGSTIYKIGNVAVSLRTQNNSMNVAKIGGVTPAADGSITFTMLKASGTPVGYLNGFTMESVYQDGTVPAAPRAVTASLATSSVVLNWVDAPFNEEGYDVYRATSVDGPFDKINDDPLAKNATTYTDGNVFDGVSYVYKVKAFNDYGESDFSNAATFGMPNIAPKIFVVGDLTMTPGSFSMLNISTTEDAVLSLTNLPSFAFESPVLPSASDVVFLPEAIHSGNYTFMATAVDSTGLSTTQNISITVNEEVLYRVYVNFNTGALNTAAGSPWNNTNDNNPLAGDVYSNLLNSAGANSGVNVTLVTAPGGSYNEGAQTGNNSGVVPDAVLKEYLWFGAFNAPATVTLKVSGLSTTNRYRFKFMASSVFTNNGTITNNGTTIFTIGSKTASVAVQNNTQNLGTITDVITNGAGEITIVASKGANTAAGYINAMIIEALPIDVSKFNPSNLTAAGYTKTSVVLNWSDNSPVETGYEIQRSTTGAEGSFASIFTTARDVNTYTDDVPVSNQLYHYRVRAVNSDGFSEFTNVAKSSAVAFKILVNISIEAKGGESFDAPAPWNNISRFGFTDDVFVGFKDDTGWPTGLGLKVKTQLEGGNNWGPTTNNNSGVVPDKVLRAFWFNDAYFPQGEFLVDGLDQTFAYNFGFMGSIDVTNAVNTDFSINGKTVTNRNDRNTTNISYLRNVKPDGDSQILFTVKETAGSPWSIFNALVIEGFATGGSANARKASDVARTGNIYEVRYGEATNKMSFYPNPVNDVMNLKIEDSSYGNVSFEYYDMTGRVVQKGEMVNKTLNPEYIIGVDLPPAMYIMKVVYPDGRFETKRFIKN